jgi:hypothetical protein
MLASIIPLMGGGCGGFAASPAISPLMFLLPGLAQAKPAPPQIAPSMQVASKRDSSQLN